MKFFKIILNYSNELFWKFSKNFPNIIKFEILQNWLKVLKCYRKKYSKLFETLLNWNETFWNISKLFWNLQNFWKFSQIYKIIVCNNTKLIKTFGVLKNCSKLFVMSNAKTYSVLDNILINSHLIQSLCYPIFKYEFSPLLYAHFIPQPHLCSIYLPLQLNLILYSFLIYYYKLILFSILILSAFYPQ